MIPGLPDYTPSLVAVDTETSGLFVDDGARISIVSAAWRSPTGEIVSRVWNVDQGAEGKTDALSLRVGPDPTCPPRINVEYYDALTWWLKRQRLTLHNAKFDLHIFAAGVRDEPETARDLSDAVVWDSQLGAWLLDPLLPQGLKPTCGRLFGESETDELEALKAWRRAAKVRKVDWGRYDLIPWDVIAPYAEQDAVLALRLAEHQMARMARADGVAEIMALELDLMKTLFRMERRGIGFDADGMRASADVLERETERMRAALPFEDTPAAIRRFYFAPEPDGLGLKPPKKTPKGDASVDKDAVIALQAGGAPFINELQDYRAAQSALTKWMRKWPGLVGTDGRLRTCYRQSNVRTGRLSCERVELMMVPAIDRLHLPEGVGHPRTFFRARPGFEIWECDLSQAELRVTAAVARCQALREDVTSGDVHGMTAKRIFGVDETHPRWKEYRQVCKVINFATGYGAGLVKLAGLIASFIRKAVSQAEVKEWRDAYYAAYPEIRKATRLAATRAEQRGWLQLVTGRRRYFSAEDLQKSYKALNAVVQGGVAEISRRWMIECERIAPGALLLQIHDSVVLELPQETAAEVVPRIQAAGAEIAEALYGIPFLVDAKQW